MKAWFVYVDYTDDGRPFYVGKGTERRMKNRELNSDWKASRLLKAKKEKNDEA